jgi:hypothetical protein
MKQLALALLLFSAFAAAQTSSACKVTFGVVAEDDLDNIHQGLSPKTLQWFDKKMQPKHPDLCYSNGAAPVVFFFSTKPAIYHGTRVVTNSTTTSAPVNGTVTNTSGEEVGTFQGETQTTSTSSTAVPYEVNYDLLYLSIETKQANGTWKVVHNFGGSTLHPTLAGFCIRNCHPTNATIEKALNWIEAGGLTDPTQSVAP